MGPMSWTTDSLALENASFSCRLNEHEYIPAPSPNVPVLWVLWPLFDSIRGIFDLEGDSWRGAGGFRVQGTRFRFQEMCICTCMYAGRIDLLTHAHLCVHVGSEQ